MGESSAARNLSRPKLTNGVWCAALSFSKCHAELKVPVDPHALNIFDGDEFNKAIRLWTYGYDFYTPNRISIAHDYEKSRENRDSLAWRKTGDPSWNDAINKAQVRLKRIAGMIDEESYEVEAIRLQKTKFGLGDRRTVHQYVKFSGINAAKGEFNADGKNRCENLAWVPFLEHPKGADYIPPFDVDTEDPLDVPDRTSVWYDRQINVGDHNDPLADFIKPKDAGDKIEDNVMHRKDDLNQDLKGREGNYESQIKKGSEHGGPDSTSTGHQSRQQIGGLRHKVTKRSIKAGLQELPPLIQLSVVFLVIGVAFSIFVQKGTGVGRKKFLARRKREL